MLTLRALRYHLVCGIALFCGSVTALHAQSFDQQRDFGFQVINRYLPSPAPPEYVAIAVAKLGAAMEPGREYRVTFTLTATPSTQRAFTLHPALLPSVGIELPYQLELANGELVIDPSQTQLDIPRRGQPPKPLQFAINVFPKRNYRYLTFAVRADDLEGLQLQPRVDIKFASVFVDVVPLPVEPISLNLLASSALHPIVRQEQELRQRSDVGVPSIEVPTALQESLPLASEVKPDRIVEVGENRIVVEGDSVRLGLFDHKRIDGDIVTIILNGRILVDSYTLRRDAYYVDLPLHTGENTVILHAENLGAVVPNTAAFVIDDGIARQQTILRSDLQRSSAFVIEYKGSSIEARRLD